MKLHIVGWSRKIYLDFRIPNMGNFEALCLIISLSIYLLFCKSVSNIAALNKIIQAIDRITIEASLCSLHQILLKWWSFYQKKNLEIFDSALRWEFILLKENFYLLLLSWVLLILYSQRIFLLFGLVSTFLTQKLMK